MISLLQGCVCRSNESTAVLHESFVRTENPPAKPQNVPNDGLINNPLQPVNQQKSPILVDKRRSPL